MNFSSDNWAGAHPEIAARLAAEAGGHTRPYGAGEVDRRVEETFSRIFEREVAVFFVATGTAANALALASVARPGGVVFCHANAHVVEDECGAVEYLSGGARLAGVAGAAGRITPEAVKAAIGRYPASFVHAGQPMAVTITQATEAGTVYALDEIAAIGSVAREAGIPLHMDGARFANALVSLGASPAEMTWRRGVDMVSFGGTKNGCFCAEAVVLFDTARAGEFAFYRKRAAQLFSKSRFIAAQFEAYFRDGLWLATARHANAMAQRLAGRLRGSGKARLGWEPQANEVFAILKRSDVARLQGEGASFYPWHTPDFCTQPVGDDETMCRFVTSFATTDDEIERLGDLLA